MQAAGEKTLAQLQSGSDDVKDKLKAILEGVKDPLSSWLDSKVQKYLFSFFSCHFVGWYVISLEVL